MRRLIVSALLVAAAVCAATAPLPIAAPASSTFLKCRTRVARPPRHRAAARRHVRRQPRGALVSPRTASARRVHGGSGHRWFSLSDPRDAPPGRRRLAAEGGERADREVRRVDLLDAPYLCRVMRVRALLSVRVGNSSSARWSSTQERQADHDGEPARRARGFHGPAAVDRERRRTPEGPYHDANSGAIGVNASGLNNTPLTNQAGAPGYPETLGMLLGRWGRCFRRRRLPPIRPPRADRVFILDDEARHAALREAHESLARDEVPVGLRDRARRLVIVSRAQPGRRASGRHPHAEVVAIGAASNAPRPVAPGATARST